MQNWALADKINYFLDEQLQSFSLTSQPMCVPPEEIFSYFLIRDVQPLEDLRGRGARIEVLLPSIEASYSFEELQEQVLGRKE